MTESSAENQIRVEFYVLNDSSATARLKLACRVAEKAYLANQSVVVWHSDAEELKTFDEMLWTFDDRSFVPHELARPDGSPCEAPVVLYSGKPPSGPVQVLINLGMDVPPFASSAQRIAEIIDGDPQRRQAGRARFKAYRDMGLQPVTHNITG